MIMKRMRNVLLILFMLPHHCAMMNKKSGLNSGKKKYKGVKRNDAWIAGGGKASVMERVTNVFCGGGGGGVAYTNLQSTNANPTPEKPSRSASMPVNNPINVANNKGLSNNSVATRARITRNNRTKNVPLASGGTGGYIAPLSWEQLALDEHFLSRFFLYFNAPERRNLAQVMTIVYQK